MSSTPFVQSAFRSVRPGFLSVAVTRRGTKTTRSGKETADVCMHKALPAVTSSDVHLLVNKSPFNCSEQYKNAYSFSPEMLHAILHIYNSHKVGIDEWTES